MGVQSFFASLQLPWMVYANFFKVYARSSLKTMSVPTKVVPVINNGRETLGKRLEKGSTNSSGIALPHATSHYMVETDIGDTHFRPLLAQQQAHGSDKPTFY